MITPTFHFSILNNFMLIFNEQAAELVNQLRPRADTGEIFDMAPYLKRCALDVICGEQSEHSQLFKFAEAAMSVKIGAQQNHHLSYVRAVDKLAEIAIKYEITPWMWSRLGFHLSGYAREFNNSLNVLTTFSSQVRATI